MKKEIFVVGDVHGEISMLKKLLQFWNPLDQQLLFVGDLGDRGENPKECFLLVQDLCEQKGAICVKGNHEDILLNFLRSPEEYAANYYLNGGEKTIQTLLDGEELSKLSPVEIAKEIKYRYPDLISFIKKMPLYYEWEQYLFVHAGVDLSKKDWKDTNTRDFLWIREPFHEAKNNTDKTIVFGHTPTFSLHGTQKNSQIWVQDNKIGIDGGAVFGGTLHGIVFDKYGMKNHYGISKNDKNQLKSNQYC